MDAQAKRAAKAAYRQANRDAAWRELGLDRAQLADLRSYLRDRGIDDCQDEFDLTRAWAMAVGLDWFAVQRGLRSQDAYCDCQAFDLDPDSTF